ncbi:hypothetical protein N5T78_10325 [Aliarcobacter cryaerophilus]|uniref:hypothetical protein n=1 Tax=Aliarcobacter cryaerophilus TaxID=28198 RepID=UPI0021B57172|nr:hypothetical protein [Aliarcobacter cryaerophilus]MCT7466977.1 hypothetical protein [Aliarcobacter cryaerophilus]
MLRELKNFNQIKNFDIVELANILNRCYSKAVRYSSNYDYMTGKTTQALDFEDNFFKYRTYYYVETKECLIILVNNYYKNNEEYFIEAIYTKPEARKQGKMQDLLLQVAQSINKKIVVDTDSLFLIHLVKKINKKCKKFIFFRMRSKDSDSKLYKYLFAKKRITKKDFKEQEEYEKNIFKKLDLKKQRS